jgi:hypothetical protein
MTGAEVCLIDTNSGRLERAKSICADFQTAMDLIVKAREAVIDAICRCDY